MQLQWLIMLFVTQNSDFSVLSVCILVQIEQNVFDFIAPVTWHRRAFIFHNKFKFIKITSVTLSCK